jgi:hypothetical protein
MRQVEKSAGAGGEWKFCPLLKGARSLALARSEARNRRKVAQKEGDPLRDSIASELQPLAV